MGSFDPEARYAALDERVTNLRTSLVSLEGEMRTSFNALTANLALISGEMRSSNKTQWPVIWSAIGVSFAIMLAVGSQAISPIKDSVVSLASQVSALDESSVPRTELAWRADRGAEDRLRNEQNVRDLRDASVTRAEWMERNHARDTDISNLQRQLDTINAEVGSTYGVRDVIVDMKAQIKSLQNERNHAVD